MGDAMNYNKETLRSLRDEIDQALAAIGARHNVQIRAGNCTFDARSATFKLTVANLTDDGTVDDGTADYFRQFAFAYDMQPDWLGREFRTGGESYKLAGLNPKRGKFPVVAYRVRDGKRFKFQAEGVAALLRVS